MATYRKRGSRWQSSVNLKNVRRSKSFGSKQDAVRWAMEQEREILEGKEWGIANKTFGELLERYDQEVSVHKKSADFEHKRIEFLRADKLADVPLKELSSKHFSQWRDRRSRIVSSASVLRDITIMNHALNTAIKDWEWLRINPLANITRPKKPRARDRLVSDVELEKLLEVLGYDYSEKPETVPARVGAATLFALETAMRAGEVVGLMWSHINLKTRTARLLKTKNGEKRDVPLSAEAIRILEQVRDGTKSVFNLTQIQIDNYFRRAKACKEIEDLHFHDTRATAITRLSKKVDILALARISGHKDLKMLQVYYRESMEDIAKRI